VAVPSPSALWTKDRSYLRLVNPIAAMQEQRRNDFDRKMLEKRRQGRVLKNMAMKQTYKFGLKAMVNN